MARRIVLLGHRHDAGTTAVASELIARSALPVLVPPELLAPARWSHHVDRDGRASTRMLLTNGQTIIDDDIGCLLNRLEYLPAKRLVRSTERDREYAALELQSLVASWLAGLGSRVVNRSNARAVDAGGPSPRGWLRLALAVGLPVVTSALATSARLLPRDVAVAEDARPLGRFRPASSPSTGRLPVEVGWSGTGLEQESTPTAAGDGDPDDEVVVIGQRAIGSLAGSVGRQCVALAELAGCAVAGFHFSRVRGHPCLGRVTTRPALAVPGRAAAVAELCLTVAARSQDVR